MVERDRETVEQNWSKRGFTCGLWTDPAGQRWEDFVHDTPELVMVIDGDVEFEIAGKVYHPEAGEELLIPSGAGSLRAKYRVHDRALAVRISAINSSRYQRLGRSPSFLRTASSVCAKDSAFFSKAFIRESRADFRRFCNSSISDVSCA